MEVSIISEQPLQMQGTAPGPFPFIDVNGYKSEIEPDGSVETGRLPEVNQFDD